MLGIYYLVTRVNGYFRTPKINDLHNLITWLNIYNKFPFIINKGLNTRPLESDSWLTGMIDSDDNFLITYKFNIKGQMIDIDLSMRISQSQNSKRFLNTNGYNIKYPYILSYFNIMILINKMLHVNLTSYNRHRQGIETTLESGYLVHVKSRLSRNTLILYLINFSLQSSKRLDYLDWVPAHNIINDKSYKLNPLKIVELKNSMNTKRTYFSWDHLRDLKDII